jgi:hypothetical protein
MRRKYGALTCHSSKRYFRYFNLLSTAKSSLRTTAAQRDVMEV